jgi:exosortase
MTQPLISTERPGRLLPLLAYAGPIACLVWAWWPTLAELAGRWSSDPSYSHGWVVPIFAVVLLWLRRQHMPDDLLKPGWVCGSSLLAAGIAFRLIGAHYYFVSFDPFSLLPCLAGVFVLVGGAPVLRWTWPSILFLAFMIPLPWSVAGLLSEPLQRFATVVSTFLLQSLGLPALAEGNVILLSEVEMGIVEACSGLRMLVVFFALSTAVAIVVQRPAWEKLLIVVSAIPIALTCNVLRITSTGVIHEAVSEGGLLAGILTHDFANKIYHDLAGWLMMPLGLGLLWAELKLLVLLWLEPADRAQPEQAVAAPMPRRGRRPWQPARTSRAALGTGP